MGSLWVMHWWVLLFSVKFNIFRCIFVAIWKKDSTVKLYCWSNYSVLVTNITNRHHPEGYIVLTYYRKCEQYLLSKLYCRFWIFVTKRDYFVVTVL